MKRIVPAALIVATVLAWTAVPIHAQQAGGATPTSSPAGTQTLAPPRVEASYVADPRDPGNDRALEALKRHLERRAPRLLAPGQKLSVEILSVYRAGHKSWTPGNDGVRVITDGAPARIELAFTLTDGAEVLIAQGKRSLRSPTYFVADRGGDPLRFEKELLDDWLLKEFSPPRG
ncbi:MAG TPA: DUF3016 domain-containing protein [Burkholderiales bacterium]|nr:DUF3016 domain-containing protein [Burkholderiales bacterium]